MSSLSIQNFTETPELLPDISRSTTSIPQRNHSNTRNNIIIIELFFGYKNKTIRICAQKRTSSISSLSLELIYRTLVIAV